MLDRLRRKQQLPIQPFPPSAADSGITVGLGMEAIGRYRIHHVLGHGGQGIVFLGSASNGAQVAIKMLATKLCADPQARQRFENELKIAQSVAGFCTAQVLDFDLASEHPYIVSEYIGAPRYRIWSGRADRFPGPTWTDLRSTPRRL